MGLGIKKNDTVLVMTGDDKGKRGRVLSVDRAGSKIVIAVNTLVVASLG